MKQHSFALLAGLLTLAVASTASANIPIISGSTNCTDGAPSVSWVVAMQSTVEPWIGPPFDENHGVSVQLSFYVGASWTSWQQHQLGELTFQNGHTFSGSAAAPSNATAVRMRVTAIYNWYTQGGSYSRNTSSYTYYAIFTLSEAEAHVYPLPTDCAPPPPPPPSGPGTGTPGFWKNHPDAWPVSSLKLGNITYTKAQLIAILGMPTQRDVTYIMARALIAALLNGLVGNDTSCIDAVVDDAQAWLKPAPVGSGVRGSSAAWISGSAIAGTLDDYNNGLLCAPHRN